MFGASKTNNRWSNILFWRRRTGIALLTIIVLLPTILLLKTGTLLLVGIVLSVFLAWGALKLQHFSWADVGLRRPTNLIRTFMAAIGATLGLMLLTYMLRPVVTVITGQGPNLEAFEVLHGNLTALLIGLVVVWTVAAFGEEMLVRGFLMNALFKLLPNGKLTSRTRWAIVLLLSSGAVSLGHAYQGSTGMILTGFIGFGFGLVYLFSNRNLWPSILAHGLYDTVAFIFVYYDYSLDQLL